MRWRRSFICRQSLDGSIYNQRNVSTRARTGSWPRGLKQFSSATCGGAWMRAWWPWIRADCCTSCGRLFTPLCLGSILGAVGSVVGAGEPPCWRETVLLVAAWLLSVFSLFSFEDWVVWIAGVGTSATLVGVLLLMFYLGSTINLLGYRSLSCSRTRVVTWKERTLGEIASVFF